jgi:oligopeptide/dipeptide ABC transporter ATP-binding protein
MVSSIRGDPPNLVDPPAGCGFCSRCDEKVASCDTEHPLMVEVEAGHFVRCVHAKSQRSDAFVRGDEAAPDLKGA